MNLKRSARLSLDTKTGFTVCTVAFGLVVNCPVTEFVPSLSFPLHAVICRSLFADLLQPTLQAVVQSYIYAVG